MFQVRGRGQSRRTSTTPTRSGLNKPIKCLWLRGLALETESHSSRASVAVGWRSSALT